MATHIIKNNTNTPVPILMYPIGFFITAQESDEDLGDVVQVYIRYAVGFNDNGGVFYQMAEEGVSIQGTLFNDFLFQSVSGVLALELQRLALNFPVDNGLIDGVVA